MKNFEVLQELPKRETETLKYCKSYQNERQRHMVSKCCWKNGTLGLFHFKLPHTLELWKMQYLPHDKGKRSKTRPALYCSLGSRVVRTKSQLSSLPQHTHTHTTQSHSQTKWSLFLIFLTTSCSSPCPFLAVCSLFHSCLTSLFSLCSFNADCQET